MTHRFRCEDSQPFLRIQRVFLRRLLFGPVGVQILFRWRIIPPKVDCAERSPRECSRHGCLSVSSYERIPAVLKCLLALAYELIDVVSRCCVMLLELHTVTPFRAFFATALMDDMALRARNLQPACRQRFQPAMNCDLILSSDG